MPDISNVSKIKRTNSIKILHTEYGYYSKGSPETGYNRGSIDTLIELDLEDTKSQKLISKIEEILGCKITLLYEESKKVNKLARGGSIEEVVKHLDKVNEAFGKRGVLDRSSYGNKVRLVGNLVSEYTQHLMYVALTSYYTSNGSLPEGIAPKAKEYGVRVEYEKHSQKI